MFQLGVMIEPELGVFNVLDIPWAAPALPWQTSLASSLQSFWAAGVVVLSKLAFGLQLSSEAKLPWQMS